MKIKLILFVVLFFLFILCGHAFEKEKNLTLSAADINKFDIDCGAGYLKITGQKDLKQIEVKATIIVEGIKKNNLTRFLKDHLKLELKKKGNQAMLTSKFKSPRNLFSLKGSTLQINLDIQVPSDLKLNVDDGSGSINIKNLSASLDIEDGSGSMKIENIDGKVIINDGSGSISLNNVAKDVKIDDGSGDVDAVGINGNLKIIDGSGSLYIKNIGGDVWVRDGSGTIQISKIEGSVDVSDGSGGIDIDRVEKDVIIHEAGSGSLHIRQVKGNIKK